MSTIKSSAENLTLNADGANNDIKFQSNGSEVASIDQAGNLTLSGTVDGVDVAAAGTLASAALPKAGGTMTGNIVMGDDTSIGISDSAERIEFDGAGDISILGAKLGVGTATPQTEMHVVTANTSLVHIGGTANANGNYQGISLGYSEAGNLNHRKVAVVSAGIQDGQARQDFHVLVDTDSNTGSVVLADSKFKIDGISGRCQAKNGLMFGSDTAAANALDDYEEGNWTPSWSPSGGSWSGTGVGKYTKIGRQVTASFNWIGSGQATGTKFNSVGGLPFTSLNQTTRYPAIVTMNGAGASGNTLNATVSANSTSINLQMQPQGTGAHGEFTPAQTGSGAEISATVTYFVA